MLPTLLFERVTSRCCAPFRGVTTTDMPFYLSDFDTLTFKRDHLQIC